MKKVFLIWAREIKLSEFLAKSLETEVVVSYKKKWRGFNIPIILRYLIQGADSYIKLRKIQPKIIFVQNPPIMAVLLAYIYCRFNKGTHYIIDTHTAGFLDKKWIFFHPLHRFLARRALYNTAHNYKNLEILKQWGINHSRVLQFYNPLKNEILDDKAILPERLERKISLKLGYKIFMVNRFANDDAWREVIATARLMPWALFFITGDAYKISDSLKKIFPANVILTGYLDHKVFSLLMHRCDIILALTKREDTVLWSLREIMALGKPFVTSDTEVLQHYFSEVALFSSHKPEELKKRIKEAWNKRFEIKGQIEMFLKKDQGRWQNDIDYLKNIIRNGCIECGEKIEKILPQGAEGAFK
ncbi:glycosyltransferase [Patescibacteria group bacterium]|nr:glycosyltransferase [Patescibacteria group bacterium]